MTVELSNVLWPAVTEENKVHVEVTQMGVQAYTGAGSETDMLSLSPTQEAAAMTVTLEKSFNTAYAASVFRFLITPNENTEFSSNNYLYVNFPTSYAPELGNVDCTVNGDRVPCTVSGPFMVTITGPSTATGLNTEFTLVINGVRQAEG
jgi:hypothetical protein